MQRGLIVFSLVASISAAFAQWSSSRPSESFSASRDFAKSTNALISNSLKIPVDTSDNAIQVLTPALPDVASFRRHQDSSDSINLVTPSIFNMSSRAASAKLQRLIQDPELKSLQLISIRPRVLESSSTRDGPVRLCEGAEPFCKAVRVGPWQQSSASARYLTGTVVGGAQGSLLLLEHEGTSFGTLSVNEVTYQIRQIGGEVHAITTTRNELKDRSKNDVHRLGSATAAPAVATSDRFDCPNPTDKQVIEVVVGATKAARDAAHAAGDDVEQLLKYAEVLANISFSKSDINGEIHIVATSTPRYDEGGDLDKIIDDLLVAGGPLDELRQLRRRRAADIGVLVVDNPDPLNCGVAAGIGVTKEEGYAVVNWKCLASRHSFIHEIGHLVGAWHDPKTVGTGRNVQPPYAYGYVTNGTVPMATIMAYRESCSTACGRGWYWSNPDAKNEYGDVLGDYGRSFDACVWRRRLQEVANFNGG